MVKARINEVLNKDCWVFLFHHASPYNNSDLTFRILTRFNESTFWSSVPVAVPTNIWGEGYNSTALTVHWEPVPDTRNEIKGKLGGYQVGISSILLTHTVQTVSCTVNTRF